jgi:hypothetical protein
MTETYLIEINTEQKQTLMAIFKAFKVRITPVPQEKKEKALADINADAKDKVFYADFIDAVEWSNAKANGEIENGQSLSDFLNEVETELETEKKLSHAH